VIGSKQNTITPIHEMGMRWDFIIRIVYNVEYRK
jgi:hypothetical protein